MSANWCKCMLHCISIVLEYLKNTTMTNKMVFISQSLVNLNATYYPTGKAMR